MAKGTSRQKKHWGTIIAVVLVIILALAMTLSVVSRGFRDWSKLKPDQSDNTEQPNTPSTDGTGNVDESPTFLSPENSGVAISAGESENASGAKLMYARIAQEDYEANGISEQAEAAVTLTITNIEPETAVNTRTVWTAKFLGDTSSWASTGSATVTDYIKITPSSDTLSATVECEQAFGTQIEVSATFQTGNKVKVITIFDYVARLSENAQIELYDKNGKANTIVFDNRVDYGNLKGRQYSIRVPDSSFGAGTIIPEVEETRDEMGLSNGTQMRINSKLYSQNCPADTYQRWGAALQSVNVRGFFIANESFLSGFFKNDQTAFDNPVKSLIGLLEKPYYSTSEKIEITYTFGLSYDGKSFGTQTIKGYFNVDLSVLSDVSSADMDQPSVVL